MNLKSIFLRVLKYLVNILVSIFSITCIFPFVWVIYSSFKTQKEFSLNIMNLPEKIRLENYINALTKGANIAFLLSRFDFRGRKIIYGLFLSGMLVPIHGLLVPVFIQFNKLGLYNTRLALIITNITFGLPITIFLIESFVKSVPIEIEEAAVIDGCNIYQRLFRVVLPTCKPVLSTSLILSFLSTWNEFPFALVLIRSSELRTIPIWLTQFSGQYSTNYPQMMAAMVIASLPVIITYFAFSNKIIDGMTAGAVKG